MTNSASSTVDREPPLMLAISAREAIRDAMAAFGNGAPVALPFPATPERIFFAIRRTRRESQAPANGVAARKARRFLRP